MAPLTEVRFPAGIPRRIGRRVSGLRENGREAVDVRGGEGNARVLSGPADQKQAGNAILRHGGTCLRGCGGSGVQSDRRGGQSGVVYGRKERKKGEK